MSNATGISAADSAAGSEPKIERSRLLNNLLLLIILLVAALVRFTALDASSLWNDEGTTWALLAHSFPQIAREAAADIHPPGYYWLLKTWTLVPGTSAWAMRSFSALLGTVLVFVVYRIGTFLPRFSRQVFLTALLAALITALSPFQVYYSQEARMYELLSLLAAGLFLALFSLARRENEGANTLLPLGAFVLFGTAGMWTHYSFPVVLAAACAAYVIQLIRSSDASSAPLSRRIVRFAAANALILGFYAPWLPTAVDRILNWPKGGDWIPLTDGILLTLQTFVTGPIRTAPALGWPWLVVALVLPVVGLWSLRAGFAGPALGLWWLAPIILMAVLGLFSDAFLKFLLVASPAWCLLVAAAPLSWGRAQLTGQALIALAAVLLAVVVLPAYYSDPVARDNYAGVARYVKAAGDPALDAVIIDAPGQQDVWSYYDAGLPVLPLPEQRPPNEEMTVERLRSALEGRRRAYAIFWATDESDPEEIVEGWLDQHAFTGMESWQGNMRFVTYSLASDLECRDFDPPVVFGEHVSLLGQCRPGRAQEVVAGDAAVLALEWLADAPLTSDYKVSVQLLDDRNQVIAQHDAVPGGGSRPTSAWAVGEIISDNHGLPIPPGTPPGAYRMIVAMYDPSTGGRLPVAGSDYLLLGDVEVVRPAAPLPAEVIAIQNRLSAPLGPVQLIGYSAHVKGQSHAPLTPVRQGDTVHFSFLWQAPALRTPDWPDDLDFTLQLGDGMVTAPLAGGMYPTDQWQPGEIVRGEFDVGFDGSDAVPEIRIGDDTVRLRRLPSQ